LMSTNYCLMPTYKDHNVPMHPPTTEPTSSEPTFPTDDTARVPDSGYPLPSQLESPELGESNDILDDDDAVLPTPLNHLNG